MIKLELSIWMLFRVQYPSKAHDTRDMGTESSYKHIKTILQEKEHTFFPNVPDISYLDWMCLGTWFRVPALCGGLDVTFAKMMKKLNTFTKRMCQK